jgi:trans-aconitate 2-methyltransferase
MVTWDPNQYLKFSDARLQPALDLLMRVPLAAPHRVYDLGCGTGNVTRLLHRRWSGAEITGVDSSSSMIAQAAQDLPEMLWVQQDLESWAPKTSADLIFSNAALHWLPRHDVLFPRLMSYLEPGGVLAVQMPNNFSAPSHMLIAETARAGSWRNRLEPILRPAPVDSPSHYYQLLEPLARSVSVWQTEYFHALQGPDPVKEWTKGTWLKPILDALDVGDRALLEAQYAQRLRLAYPALASGVTLFPFKRLFLLASRA